MINVVDRVPTYPNRIKLTKSNGTSEYVTWERADEPTVAGTPINKALFDSIVADIGLSKHTTVYVSQAGSDALGDGTAANPYATITKALSTLPKNLNGYDARLSIDSGTYAEDIEIARFGNGNIVLTGESGAAVSIKSLRVMYGATAVTENIELTITGTYGNYGIAVTQANLICLAAVILNGAANNSVYASRNSFCMFATTLTINNSNQIGVHATSRSSVYIGTIQGANNKGTGIQSTNGSMVAFAVRNITAAASFLTQNGGRIYTDSQTSTPNY